MCKFFIWRDDCDAPVLIKITYGCNLLFCHMDVQSYYKVVLFLPWHAERTINLLFKSGLALKQVNIRNKSWNKPFSPLNLLCYGISCGCSDSSLSYTFLLLSVTLESKDVNFSLECVKKLHHSCDGDWQEKWRKDVLLMQVS